MTEHARKLASSHVVSMSSEHVDPVSSDFPKHIKDTSDV